MKITKMMQWLKWRVRVTMNDGRVLLGTLSAYDRHMNLVLADCEEFRTIKSRNEPVEKTLTRMLGLIILRGETVISILPETPPVAAAIPLVTQNGPKYLPPAGFINT